MILSNEGIHVQHKGRRNSFFSSCTGGPPCYSMKWGNYPLAHVNPGCNSCLPSYEERAHVDGCTHLACASCGRAESEQMLHLPWRNYLLSSLSPPLSPKRGKSKNMKFLCGWSSVVVKNIKKEKGRMVMGKRSKNMFPLGWTQVFLTRKAREAMHSNAEKKEMVLHFSQSHKSYQRASNGKTVSRGIFIQR